MMQDQILNHRGHGGHREATILCLLSVLGGLLFLTRNGNAQDIKVTLLGTGNPRPVLSRFGPSTLVEAGKQKLIFDCGRGVAMRIYQLGIPFDDITGLFLTHLHSDHTVGIPDLWLTGWVMGRDKPLPVWGPAGTKSMMMYLEKAYAFDIHIRRDVDTKLPGAGAEVNAHDIQQGVVYDRDGVKVTAFLVDHGEIKPAYGYRVDYAGHSVTMSGDTRPNDNLVKFAKGTDVLIHEVIDVDDYENSGSLDTSEQTKKIIGHHTTAEQAGVIFSRVKPKLAVYSHIVPPDVPNVIPHTRKTYSGALVVGEDLMTIEIGNKVEVHPPVGKAEPTH